MARERPRAARAPAPHRLWQLLFAPEEWVFTHLAGSRPVPDSRGTFLVACHRHRGDRVALADGTVVERGDPIAEIHFWNGHIANRAGSRASSVTWRIVADFRDDLGALARAIAAGRIAGEAKAVYGASPVAGAAARFGFLVRPMPRGLRRSLLTTWQHLIRWVFRPAAVGPAMEAETAEMWMSTAELMRRFGGRTGHRPGERVHAQPQGGGMPRTTAGPSAWG